MNYRMLFVLCLLLITSNVRAQEGGTQSDSPYGVCAHLARGDEYNTARQELQLMKKAGIQWVRADFSWSSIQPSKGKWRFKPLDRVVKLAGKTNVRILPILDYSVSWADPAHKHLDAWKTYVRRVVQRYKNQINVWEVWNEPNIDKFWPDPDPAAYAKLLKVTYKTIKDVDPDQTVVLSGMAGIPMSYLRKLYEKGAGEYFDVMNVHPYRYPRPPEASPRPIGTELNELRELMTSYNDGDKSIWITEMGWPTHRPRIDAADGLYTQVFRSGLNQLLPDNTQGDLGVVLVPGLPSPADLLGSTVERIVPEGMGIRTLALDHIGSIDPDRVPVLLLPGNEGFPASARKDLVRYVKQGGIFLHASHGVPFFRQLTRDDQGGWSGERDQRLENQLHLGWVAHWQKDHIPAEARNVTVAPAVKGRIQLGKTLPAGKRFLTEQKLRKDDRMIPLIRAGNGSYEGTVAAAYDYDSELNGGAVILTLNGRGSIRGVTERRQAELLVRSMLLAFQHGVDRFFWYEFKAAESDPYDNESHFGLLHEDLSPKPGYRAYHTLTRVRPAGSRSISYREFGQGFHGVKWKRPDGRMGWALWQRGARRTIRLRMDGSLDRITNYMGQTPAVQRSGDKLQLKVGPGPIYVIGSGTIKPLRR